MMTIDINNENSFKIILRFLNILYLEDEENIKKNIKETLELIVSDVYDVETCEQANLVLKEKRIDIIISDINLKEESGLSFIKILREKNIDIPVILLTAYTDKSYLLEATKLKLVDYLIKPTDYKTLHNCLMKAAKEICQSGSFVVEFKNGIIYNVLNKRLFSKTEKNEFELTPKEIQLLDFLIKNSNRVSSYEEIKDNIWEDSSHLSESALKNLVNKLRKKIGKNGIINVSGIGFKVELV